MMTLEGWVGAKMSGLCSYYTRWGHALSGHREFRTDPERLVMEREAWERARELAATYNIRYDEEFVEGALDTYRDWLHQRSACPECGLTRYQTVDGRWHCPLCEGL